MAKKSEFFDKESFMSTYARLGYVATQQGYNEAITDLGEILLNRRDLPIDVVTDILNAMLEQKGNRY